MQSSSRFILHASLFIVLISACTAQPTLPPPPPGDVIPFATSTRSPQALRTPEGLVPLTTPLPSPTPFTYQVKAGDTMSYIAEKFGVSLDDLLAANPEISSNAMSVGTTLKIPSDPANPSGEPTPTPAPFTVEQIECYPTADGGMWCFVLAHNDFPDFIENVSAQVSLVDADGKVLGSQIALLPLNILPPNTSLPLAAYFPNVPANAKPLAQILTAIKLLPNDKRYLPASVNNTLVQVNADGRSAQVNGKVLLNGKKDASQVWVTGTAYDESGRVVGVRRWESKKAIDGGGNIPFEFIISSAGGKIARVEFAVEARP
ncbi:MAG: LysM peptidoglycan-binding domain-containing protein [Anaerolineales bacterium]